jgi:hypothetical protein
LDVLVIVLDVVVLRDLVNVDGWGFWEGVGLEK